MAKGYKNLDANEFEKIKKMFGYGLNVTQVHKICERSAYTVSIVKQAKDFNEYKDITRARYEEEKNAKTATVPAAVSATPHQLTPDPNVANTISAINQQLNHLEKQLQEVIDTQNALLAVAGKGKIIW